jgi:hypothetical protein
MYVFRAFWGVECMKLGVDPPRRGGGGNEFKRKDPAEFPVDAAEEEEREGRNWAVIVILLAIILSWAVGLVFLLWSLLG